MRREFGPTQGFELANVGGRRVFSEFLASNPQTGGTYRVVIRGEGLGDNYCSCPDYATNTLGTCKHIEFTLASLGQRPGARKALAGRYRPPWPEVYLRYGEQREVVFAPGRRDGVRLQRVAAACFDENGVLMGEAYRLFPEFLERARRIAPRLRCYDDAAAFVTERCQDLERQDRLDELFGGLGRSPTPARPRVPPGARTRRRGSGHGPEALAGLLKTRLYAYQEEGVLFAARAGRALLGDDMGLGKTVQALGFAELMAREFGTRRTLVVCPASLKYQWKEEIERFTERQVTVVEGLAHQRRELYARDADYYVVNYDVVYRDVEAIRQLRPDIVILDEAQRIKNWETRTARSVKQIQSRYALVLTGTPLENRLEELYSIVQFIDRYRLGPLFRLRDNHQVTDPETGRVTGYRRLSAIGRSLRPVLLRRRKGDVELQLPERTDNTFFVPMTPGQWAPHEENREIVAQIVARWRRHGFLSEQDQKRLTVSLQRMRMACDSTYLVDHTTRDHNKPQELLALLEEVLAEDSGVKVVIFSQWLRMQELMADALEDGPWGFVRFHGGVEPRRRRLLVRQFQTDPDTRLFLATDAGGTGLNLQAGSVVVNVDLPWNPAVLEQRIGRVHRLGQHRRVRVVNLVSEGTIEHGMIEVLRFKRELFEGVLDGGADTVDLGGTRLTRFMESVEAVTAAVPATSRETDVLPEAAGMAAEAAAAEIEPAAGPAKDGRTAGVPTAVGRPALAELVTAGARLLEQLALALGQGSAPAAGQSEAKPQDGDGGVPGLRTERDSASGQTYLRVPLPHGEALAELARAARPLLEFLAQRGR